MEEARLPQQPSPPQAHSCHLDAQAEGFVKSHLAQGVGRTFCKVLGSKRQTHAHTEVNVPAMRVQVHWQCCTPSREVLSRIA